MLTRLPIVFILLGCVLRFIHPGTIEFKGDERLMFDLARQAADGHWAQIGIPSSQGVSNPALSVHLFGVLAWIIKALGISLNPISLSMSVAVVSCASLVIATGMGLKFFKDNDQAVWLWGVSIVATQPTEILLYRKIWAQSLLPIFMIFWIMTIWLWLYGQRDRLYAFILGILMFIPGQIHMPGFFYTTSIAGLWLFLSLIKSNPWISNRHIQKTKQSFSMFLMGSLISALALIPWIRHVLDFSKNHHSKSMTIDRIQVALEFSYPIKLSQKISGLDLNSIFKNETLGFLFEYPWVFGFQILLAAIFIGSISKFFLKKKPNLKTLKPTFITGMTFLTLIAYGTLISILGFRSYIHYFCVAFPFYGILLILLLKNALKNHWQIAVAAICTINMITCYTIIHHLHFNGTRPNGNFGIPYEAQ